MKNPSYLLLMFLLLSRNLTSQEIIKTEEAIYTINGTTDFTITKTDAENNKVLFTVETQIPNKKQKEVYYYQANNATFELIGDNIVIVYDVWQKTTGTKDCSVKIMDINSGVFNNPKLLYSTKLNSVYSEQELIYTAFYSPDKTKLAILKDNISTTYDIDAELNIYDTRNFEVLSSIKMNGKYEGKKRVFDIKNISIDNEGNVNTIFHLINEETKITTKSYSADIPFKSEELMNIEELGVGVINEIGGNTNEHGRFYKTIEDFSNDNYLPGVRIKNGSFSGWDIGGGKFELIDDAGNLLEEKSKNLLSDLFTFKTFNTSEPFLIRIIENKPYIVLAVGNLNYYSLYFDQIQRFYSEGWNGELKEFNIQFWVDLLKKYELLEDYKSEQPKREFSDDTNSYFNKTLKQEIKYFNLINEKM